jgi:beta-glucosidase
MAVRAVLLFCFAGLADGKIPAVANTVGPRLVDAWVERENITTVVHSGLLDQKSGHTVADVLYSNMNPSGKLTYTITKTGPASPNGICTSTDYKCHLIERVYVDCRWFDAKNIANQI